MIAHVLCGVLKPKTVNNNIPNWYLRMKRLITICVLYIVLGDYYWFHVGLDTVDPHHVFIFNVLHKLALFVNCLQYRLCCVWDTYVSNSAWMTIGWLVYKLNDILSDAPVTWLPLRQLYVVCLFLWVTLKLTCVTNTLLTFHVFPVNHYFTRLLFAVALIFQIHKEVGGRMNHTETHYWCKMQWEKEVYGQIYGVYMFLAILVIPLSIMVFTYASICHRVWVLDNYRPTVVKQRYS